MVERFARAEAAAAAEGVELWITSGWRSAEEQQALVENSLAAYGSTEEARRWVLPPEKSAHVAGLAIDVGPEPGARWLDAREAEFGLCRTYENEWWHFELMPDGGCPQRLPDSSWGW
jgi:LAS superfamily LD-carboxypeptidase LdcB